MSNVSKQEPLYPQPPTTDPEDIFNFVSPSEMSKTVQKVFFRWLMESQDVPPEVRKEAEHVWFLLEYLGRKG